MQLGKVSCLLPVVFLVGCASYQLVPTQQQSAKVGYYRSLEYVTVGNSHLGMVAVGDVINGQQMIQVVVQNRTAHAVIVKDSDFTVEYSEDGLSWKAGQMYSSQEYYDSAKQKSATNNAISSIGVGLSVAGDSVSGNSAGANETYANQLNQQDQHAAFLSWLKDSLFYAETISPNKAYDGYLVPRSLNGNHLRLTLQIRGFEPLSVEFDKVRK